MIDLFEPNYAGHGSLARVVWTDQVSEEMTGIPVQCCSGGDETRPMTETATCSGSGQWCAWIGGGGVPI